MTHAESTRAKFQRVADVREQNKCARAIRAGVRPEQVVSSLAVHAGLALSREPRTDDHADHVRERNYRWTCPDCGPEFKADLQSMDTARTPKPPRLRAVLTRAWLWMTDGGS